jgi:glycosyltransferase involved in cell wall biosynthesis
LHTCRRVALLMNSIPPYRLAVLRELQERSEGFQVLISGSLADYQNGLTNWGGLPVIHQKTISFRGTWRHPHNFREPLAIHFPYDTISQLARLRPNLIVSLEFGLRTLQAAAYKTVSKQSRLVVWAALSEVTEQGRGWLRKLLRRLLLRYADAVIVNGESGARYLTRFGIDPQKLFPIPQTTDIALFLSVAPNRPSTVRHRLLYAGRLIELKGLLPFLSNLADWARKNTQRRIEFWIAGDGPVGAQLAAFPCPENLSLRLLGQVEYDRLPDVYEEAGILVLPTLADEWGLVVVEAMAAGLPVLGSIYSQAVEELVSDGENGWLFRPDSPDNVRGVLEQSLNGSEECLNEMGAAARKRVQGLTPAAIAERMMVAVDYALANRPHSS